MVKLLLIFFVFNFFVVEASDLQVVTTDFPPYQVENNNVVEGLTTDVVKEVLHIAKVDGVIKMYPWARAYKMAIKEPNTLIYSMSRTPEREKQFKWIGVIAPYEVFMWKLTNRKDIDVKSLEDGKKYLSGGVNDDIKANHLIKNGYIAGKNLELSSSDIITIRKLIAGRIDIMPYDELSLNSRVAFLGYKDVQLTKMLKIKGISHDLYLAASLNTPDSLIKKLQRTLEEFHKTKKYKAIQAKFTNY